MAKMMTKVGIAALALSIGAIAGAQTNGPTGFSVRVGAFFPNTGSSKIDVGVDYKFRNVNLAPQGEGTQPAYLGLSLDYYGDGDTFAVPLAVTYNVRASRNFLAFAGIGADYSKEGTDSDGKFGLAGQVGASYEFATEGENANPVFVSARYYFSNRSDLRGFSVQVGYRF